MAVSSQAMLGGKTFPNRVEVALKLNLRERSHGAGPGNPPRDPGTTLRNICRRRGCPDICLQVHDDFKTNAKMIPNRSPNE